jgi:hypothetical protein
MVHQMQTARQAVGQLGGAAGRAGLGDLLVTMPVSGRLRSDGVLTAVPGGKRQLAEHGMPASPGAGQ